jgi:hypothetical protein
MLNVFMVSVVMLNVVMLNVVMLNVVAPLNNVIFLVKANKHPNMLHADRVQSCLGNIRLG